MVRSPVDICLGTSPSQAAKSRPFVNASPAPIAATIALERVSSDRLDRLDRLNHLNPPRPHGGLEVDGVGLLARAWGVAVPQTGSFPCSPWCSAIAWPPSVGGAALPGAELAAFCGGATRRRAGRTHRRGFGPFAAIGWEAGVSQLLLRLFEAPT